jgi:hypothetical protein
VADTQVKKRWLLSRTWFWALKQAFDTVPSYFLAGQADRSRRASRRLATAAMIKSAVIHYGKLVNEFNSRLENRKSYGIGY